MSLLSNKIKSAIEAEETSQKIQAEKMQEVLQVYRKVHAHISLGLNDIHGKHFGECFHLAWLDTSITFGQILPSAFMGWVVGHNPAKEVIATDRIFYVDCAICGKHKPAPFVNVRVAKYPNEWSLASCDIYLDTPNIEHALEPVWDAATSAVVDRYKRFLKDPTS